MTPEPPGRVGNLNVEGIYLETDQEVLIIRRSSSYRLPAITSAKVTVLIAAFLYLDSSVFASAIRPGSR